MPRVNYRDAVGLRLACRYGRRRVERERIVQALDVGFDICRIVASRVAQIERVEWCGTDAAVPRRNGMDERARIGERIESVIGDAACDVPLHSE